MTLEENVVETNGIDKMSYGAQVPLNKRRPALEWINSTNRQVLRLDPRLVLGRATPCESARCPHLIKTC